MSPSFEQGVTLLIGAGMKDKEAVATMNQVVAESSITDVAQQIAKQRGITLSQAYRYAREEQVQEPAPEGWSTKDHILEALYRLNANAGVTFDTLYSTLKGMGVKTNHHELTALLWDHHKIQNVAFKEHGDAKHAAGGHALNRIRLTPKGRARIVEKRGTTKQAVVRVNAKAFREKGHDSTNRGGSTHTVGRDGTDYRNHRKVAQGGPVEIVAPGTKRQPEIVPTETYKPPKLGDPLPQNMKAPLEPMAVAIPDETSPFGASIVVIDETSEGPKSAESTGKSAEVAQTEGTADTHTQYRVPNIHKYQYLEALLRRRDARAADQEKAEKMLEAAAMIAEIDPTQSDILMERARQLEGPPMSNIEQDMLRYIDEVTGAK